MKQINKLLKIATITSIAISFFSLSIATIGGLINSSSLVLFWYLGLIGIWVLMVTSIAASVLFFFNFGCKWLAGHRHNHQHTAI
jgi:hypothetical protein